MMGNDVLWVVCANDFPDGLAFTTEVAAIAYCKLRNDAVKAAIEADRAAPRIRFHYHRVEVTD